MTIIMLTYAIDSGIPLSSFVLFDNGDDCILIMEESSRTKWDGIAAWYESAGFLLKVEAPVWCLEKVSFCQTQPVFDGTRWRMVRDPHVSTSKDSTLLLPFQTEKQMRRYLRGIRDCGLALTDALPVLPQYYYALEPSSGEADIAQIEDTGFYRLSRGMEFRSRPVHPEARLSFARAFDIYPDEQVAMENAYRRQSPVQWSFDTEVAATPLYG
jgi:hypothetical protein